MERRGHAVPGMDAVYVHPTPEMRQQLCDHLQQLWDKASPRDTRWLRGQPCRSSTRYWLAHEKALKPEREQADATRTPEVLTRARQQQARQAGRSRG